jgi:hypothetical protein
MRRLPPVVLLAIVLCIGLRSRAASAEEPPVAAPAPAPAVETPPPRTAAEAGVATAGSFDTRRQGSDDVLSPRRELEVTSSLAFVTSRGAMAGVPALYFTDVGLWDTQVAASLAPRLRLSGAVVFLAKQPSTIDEPFWQSAALGVAYALTPRSALALGVDAGEMLFDEGLHGSVGLALEARRRMNQLLSWEGRLGTRATRLFFDDDLGDARAWFAEADASGQVQLCWGECRYHYGATWFGIDLAVPFYDHASGVAGGAPATIDPRTRLGVTMGTFVNVSPSWDMLLTLSWIDRGDAENPATELPILDGGFDQVQLGIGLVWHVSFDGCEAGDRSPDCPRRRDYERYE